MWVIFSLDSVIFAVILIVLFACGIISNIYDGIVSIGDNITTYANKYTFWIMLWILCAVLLLCLIDIVIAIHKEEPLTPTICTCVTATIGLTNIWVNIVELFDSPLSFLIDIIIILLFLGSCFIPKVAFKLSESRIFTLMTTAVTICISVYVLLNQTDYFINSFNLAFKL